MGRPSHFIRRRPGSNALHAVRFAANLKRPLNTFVTVNITHTSCPIDVVSKRFAELRNQRFQRWADYKPRGISEARNGPPTFIWSIENSNGVINIHWLVYISPKFRKEFDIKIIKWVKSIMGPIDDTECVVDIKDAYNPEGAKLYMMKGLEPVYAKAWKIRHKYQGLVIGKRCGTSINIGRSARMNME